MGRRIRIRDHLILHIVLCATITLEMMQIVDYSISIRYPYVHEVDLHYYEDGKSELDE